MRVIGWKSSNLIKWVIKVTLKKKKKKTPLILLKLKKLFIETVAQDGRSIFYVADILFRSNCRLYFFMEFFYFPVFLTNLHVKVI